MVLMPTIFLCTSSQTLRSLRRRASAKSRFRPLYTIATVAGAGGSVQVVTKGGSNFLHGSVYEYFRNEAFNADDANLKAVGEGRPEMRRNVYGAALGGPLRKNKAFFFVSYQGTREANGATDQSLYKSVLIAPGLTDDRSTATLMNTFGVPSIDPISLQLLNLKLSKRKVSDSHASECAGQSHGNGSIHLP